MPLSSTQHSILKRMILGLASSLFIMLIAVYLVPETAEQISFNTRVLLFGYCALIPLLSLAYVIARIAAQRFVDSQAPNAQPTVDQIENIKQMQAIAQNTLEQATLACFVYLISSLLLDENLLRGVIVASSLFAIGRILFIKGYNRGVVPRALGFALSFYPTLILLFFCLSQTLNRLF